MPADIEKKLIYQHEWDAIDDLVPAGSLKVYATDSMHGPIEVVRQIGDKQHVVSLPIGAVNAIRASHPNHVWQDERPDQSGRCPISTMMRLCAGRWIELRGRENRVGWLWSCSDAACPHTATAF